MYVLGGGPLAATAADTAAVDNVTLLSLVPETAGLVGARGTAGAVDDLQLAKLSMHSQLMFNEYTNLRPVSQENRIIPPSTVAMLAESFCPSQLCIRTRTRIKKRIMSDCFFF